MLKINLAPTGVWQKNNLASKGLKTSDTSCEIICMFKNTPSLSLSIAITIFALGIKIAYKNNKPDKCGAVLILLIRLCYKYLKSLSLYKSLDVAVSLII